MKHKAEALFSGAADAVFRCRPRRQPPRAQLERARIISHRGERDDVNVRENTTAAFDAALQAGVQALEFDVRYTLDNEPVVIHDEDLSRVFGQPTVVADTAWSTLRDRAPEVPHLETFLARYAGRAHLMMELKERAPGIGEARMLRLLDALAPVTDFHVLALEEELFAAVRELPRACRVPVARFNSRRMLDYALTHDCAGLAGAWMLLGGEHVDELQAAGKLAGTGFVASQNVLWREIGRGVDWIFSNCAGELQQALNQARGA